MKKILSLLCALVATAAMAQTTGTAKATIDGQEVEIGWVQLWKDGPRFATRNVGATGASDKESTLGTEMTFTEAAKTGSDYVWGANWKTPSKDEMDLLNTDKVTCSYVQQDDMWGFKFTGKGDYTSNSIFLPAEDGYEGYCDDCYWTSSESGSDYAWFLGLDYDEDDEDDVCDWYTYKKTEHYKVRPVLAIEPSSSTPVTLSEDDKTYSHTWDASKTYDITVNRTMTSGRWNTLMLPFNMTSEEIKSNFGESAQVMKMTGIENNVVSFESATTIEYDKPYIVEPATDIAKIEVKDKTVTETTGYHSEVTATGFMIACQFNQTTIEESTYNGITCYVLSNNNFYQIDSDVTVKGFRWTIADISGDNARTLTLSLDGVATGINEVEGLNGLNGSNSSNGSNGKFIQDGRMVIVNNGKKFNTAGQNIK